MSYEPLPRYPPIGGSVLSGWDEIVADCGLAPDLIMLDGPAVLDWDRAVAGLTGALSRHGVDVHRLDVRQYFAPWDRILESTASAELPDDPDFATLAQGTLATLFDGLPTLEPRLGRTSSARRA